MDVSGGIYEVLNPQEDCGKSPVGNGKARTNATFPKGYSTYAVPRGVNGTPPRTRTIPPAVPPRNRNVSEGDIVVGSLGSSPNDKQRSFARTLSYSGDYLSPQMCGCMRGGRVLCRGLGLGNRGLVGGVT